MANVPSAVLKFDTDFDFDFSNAQFVKEGLEREVHGTKGLHFHILLFLNFFFKCPQVVKTLHFSMT